MVVHSAVLVGGPPWGFRTSLGCDGSIIMAQVIQLSRAAKAGLRVGDAIVRLDKKQVGNLNYGEVQALIKNASGVLRVSYDRPEDPLPSRREPHLGVHTPLVKPNVVTVTSQPQSPTEPTSPRHNSIYKRSQTFTSYLATSEQTHPQIISGYASDITSYESEQSGRSRCHKGRSSESTNHHGIPSDPWHSSTTNNRLSSEGNLATLAERHLALIEQEPKFSKSMPNPKKGFAATAASITDAPGSANRVLSPSTSLPTLHTADMNQTPALPPFYQRNSTLAVNQAQPVINIRQQDPEQLSPVHEGIQYNDTFTSSTDGISVKAKVARLEMTSDEKLRQPASVFYNQKVASSTEDQVDHDVETTPVQEPVESKTLLPVPLNDVTGLPSEVPDAAPSSVPPLRPDSNLSDHPSLFSTSIDLEMEIKSQSSAPTYGDVSANPLLYACQDDARSFSQEPSVALTEEAIYARIKSPPNLQQVDYYVGKHPVKSAIFDDEADRADTPRAVASAFLSNKLRIAASIKAVDKTEKQHDKVVPLITYGQHEPVINHGHSDHSGVEPGVISKFPFEEDKVNKKTEYAEQNHSEIVRRPAGDFMISDIPGINTGFNAVGSETTNLKQNNTATITQQPSRIYKQTATIVLGSGTTDIPLPVIKQPTAMEKQASATEPEISNDMSRAEVSHGMPTSLYHQSNPIRPTFKVPQSSYTTAIWRPYAAQTSNTQESHTSEVIVATPAASSPKVAGIGYSPIRFVPPIASPASPEPPPAPSSSFGESTRSQMRYKGGDFKDDIPVKGILHSLAPSAAATTQTTPRLGGSINHPAGSDLQGVPPPPPPPPMSNGLPPSMVTPTRHFQPGLNATDFKPEESDDHHEPRSEIVYLEKQSVANLRSKIVNQLNVAKPASAAKLDEPCLVYELDPPPKPARLDIPSLKEEFTSETKFDSGSRGTFDQESAGLRLTSSLFDSTTGSSPKYEQDSMFSSYRPDFTTGSDGPPKSRVSGPPEPPPSFSWHNGKSSVGAGVKIMESDTHHYRLTASHSEMPQDRLKYRPSSTSELANTYFPSEHRHTVIGSPLPPPSITSPIPPRPPSPSESMPTSPMPLPTTSSDIYHQTAQLSAPVVAKTMTLPSHASIRTGTFTSTTSEATTIKRKEYSTSPSREVPAPVISSRSHEEKPDHSYDNRTAQRSYATTGNASYYAVPHKEIRSTNVNRINHRIPSPLDYQPFDIPKADSSHLDEGGSDTKVPSSPQDNQHNWYKMMYRKLHHLEKDEPILRYRMKVKNYWDESLAREKQHREPPKTYKTTYKMPDYLSEPETEEERPYHLRPFSTLPYKSKKAYMESEKHVRSRSSGRRQTSPERPVVKGTPAGKPYRVQPKRIEDYVPGKSTLADFDFEHYQSDGGIAGGENRKPRAGYHKAFTSSFLQEENYRRSSGNSSKDVAPPSREEAKQMYRVIQDGGEVPYGGLRQPAPQRHDSFLKFALHELCSVSTNPVNLTNTTTTTATLTSPPVIAPNIVEIDESYVIDGFIERAEPIQVITSSSTNDIQQQPSILTFTATPPPYGQRKHLSKGTVTRRSRSAGPTRSSYIDPKSTSKFPAAKQQQRHIYGAGTNFPVKTTAEKPRSKSAGSSTAPGALQTMFSPVRLSCPPGSGLYAYQRAKVHNFHVPEHRVATSTVESPLQHPVHLKEPAIYFDYLKQICTNDNSEESAEDGRVSMRNQGTSTHINNLREYYDDVYRCSQSDRASSESMFNKTYNEAMDAIRDIEIMTSPNKTSKNRTGARGLLKQTSMYRSSSLPLVIAETVKPGCYIAKGSYKSLKHDGMFDPEKMIQRQYCFSRLMQRYRALDSPRSPPASPARTSSRVGRYKQRRDGQLKRVRSLPQITECPDNGLASIETNDRDAYSADNISDDNLDIVEPKKGKTLAEVPVLEPQKSIMPYECDCFVCQTGYYMSPQFQERTIFEVALPDTDYFTMLQPDSSGLYRTLFPLRRSESVPSLGSPYSALPLEVWSNLFRRTWEKFPYTNSSEPLDTDDNSPFAEIEKALQYVTQTSNRLAEKRAQESKIPKDSKHGYLNVTTGVKEDMNHQLSNFTDQMDFVGIKPEPSRPSPDGYPAKEARALHTFKAQTNRELNFRKGDKLLIRREIDSNWYEGEHDGRVGIFPTNYVKVLGDSPEKENGIFSQLNLESDIIEGQAKALYNFESRSDNELKMRKGDTVALIRRIDDNWWEGKAANGQRGIFPTNYVQTIREPISYPKNFGVAAPRRSLSPSKGSLFRPHKSETDNFAKIQVNGTAYGEKDWMVRENRTKQSMSVPRETGTKSRSAGSSSLRRSGGKSPKLEDIDTYQAMFAYSPQHPDELELDEGDVVMVVEKCDDGWYIGTSLRTGSFGTFPGNYVQLLCK